MTRNSARRGIKPLGTDVKTRNQIRQPRLLKGKKRNRGLSSRIKGGLAVLGIFFFLFHCWWPQHQKVNALKQRSAALEERRAELTANNQMLQEKINWLGTEIAVERMAREELGLIKPGEQVLMKVNVAK